MTVHIHMQRFLMYVNVHPIFSLYNHVSLLNVGFMLFLNMNYLTSHIIGLKIHKCTKYGIEGRNIYDSSLHGYHKINIL